MIVVTDETRRLPPPARSEGRRPGRRRHARHPRGPRIERARPPGVRLHEQRHLLGAPGGNRRPPDRRADASRRATRAKRSSWSPAPLSSTPAAPRRSALIRNGWVQALLGRQRAGRARYRSGAARHFARRAPERRPPGRTRPPQSHARHQRHLSRRQHRPSAVRNRPAQARHHVRMRASERAVRAGRQPARRWPAARHHHRHESGAGRLRRAAEGRRAGAVPRLHAALHRHRQHAAELGENRVRRYQPRRRHQSQRSRHRTGRRRGHRRRPVPRSARAHARRNSQT